MASGGTDVDLSGVSLAVGSKEFTEQLVLGQVVVQALEAAGAEVEDRTNLTGTSVVRRRSRAARSTSTTSTPAPAGSRSSARPSPSPARRSSSTP